MGRIYLARPGTTDFDEQDRIVGTLDIPLNVRGQAELARMAEQLRGVAIDTVYATAGAAARQSAEFLGLRLQTKVRILDDLRNLDFGLWQGLKVDEVRRKHRKVFKQWEDSPCAICPPAGEMIDQVLERVQRDLKPVLKRAKNGACVLFAPQPLRQVISCHLKQLDISHLWDEEKNSLWEMVEVP